MVRSWVILPEKEDESKKIKAKKKKNVQCRQKKLEREAGSLQNAPSKGVSQTTTGIFG